ncbi:MAG: hypothetical protein ACRD3W_16695, partial [Terriglobales bacterium]
MSQPLQVSRPRLERPTSIGRQSVTDVISDQLEPANKPYRVISAILNMDPDEQFRYKYSEEYRQFLNEKLAQALTPSDSIEQSHAKGRSRPRAASPQSPPRVASPLPLASSNRAAASPLDSWKGVAEQTASPLPFASLNRSCFEIARRLLSRIRSRTNVELEKPLKMNPTEKLILSCCVSDPDVSVLIDTIEHLFREDPSLCQKLRFASPGTADGDLRTQMEIALAKSFLLQGWTNNLDCVLFRQIVEELLRDGRLASRMKAAIGYARIPNCQIA